MPAPAFAPPHPVAIFRVLKQAWREYLLSGNACAIDVAQPPDQLVTDDLTVSGIVYIDQSVPMLPPSATLLLYLDEDLVTGRSTPIDPVTGAYSATFTTPFSAPGTAYVTVGAPQPLHLTQSGNFTVT